jgi:hypothetical protein
MKMAVLWVVAPCGLASESWGNISYSRFKTDEANLSKYTKTVFWVVSLSSLAVVY